MSSSTITTNDVLHKFNELRKKYYYTQGYITCKVPDEISSRFITSNPQLLWTPQYNHYVSDKVRILTTNITVPLKGYDFTVCLERPYKPDHHREFEDYFGFGGHCEGYTDQRIIIRFPDSFIENINIDYFIMSGGESISHGNYAKEVCMLLIFGGYVKYWNAFTIMNDWFAENNCPGFDTANENGSITSRDTIIPYIFNNYLVPVSVSVPEPDDE